MPLLNPGSVLSSPYLSDDFQIITRAETVGTNGRSTLVESSPVAAYGTVCVAGANDLERLPEASRAKRVMSFVTPTQVKPIGPTNQPDIIVWPVVSPPRIGARWVVVDVGPYPAYGDGWYQVLAASMDMEDNPL